MEWLTPQKNLQSLDTDVSAIMESEGFAVRQYSGVNIEPTQRGLQFSSGFNFLSQLQKKLSQSMRAIYLLIRISHRFCSPVVNLFQ